MIFKSSFSYLLLFLIFTSSCNKSNDQEIRPISVVSCSDGIQNGDENGVDCGGTCALCPGIKVLEGELFDRLKLDIRFEYLVTGPFLIRDGAILEVPAGIKIKVKENVGAYIAVAQGGKLFTWGTKDNPVIITSNSKNPAPGDWGGLIFCGKAPVSNGIQSRSELGDFFYGGNDPSDGSGSLRYTRIEYAGAVYEDEIRFNALSFFGVGNYTSLNNITVFEAAGTSFKWFGGTVNSSYLFSNKSGSVGMEIADGWQGTGSFWHSYYNQISGIQVENQFFASSNDRNNQFNLSNISIVGTNNSFGIHFEEGNPIGLIQNLYLSDVFIGVSLSGEKPFGNLSSSLLNFQSVQVENYNQLSNQSEVFPNYIQQLDASGSGSKGDIPEWADF